MKTGRRGWDSRDEDEEQNQATKMKTGRRGVDSRDEDKERNQDTKMKTGIRDRDSRDEDEEVNHTDKENAEETAGDDKENAEYKRGEKEPSHVAMEWDSDFHEGFEQALLKHERTKEAKRLDSLVDRKKKQYGNASRAISSSVREDRRRAPVSSRNGKPRQRESEATDDPVSAARSTSKGSEAATRSPHRRGGSQDTRGRRSSGGPDGDDPEFRPQDLAKFLGRQDGFQAPVGDMRDSFSWQVNRALASLPHIFCMKNERMKLRPKIRVCSAYTSRRGCIDRASCFKIHICSGFVFGDCALENCSMGHRLRTNHNIKAIQAFYLECLSDSQLCRLIKMNEVALQRETTQRHLDVCRDYSKDRCNKSCGALHICLDFVIGLGDCSRPKCPLSHELFSSENYKLLHHYDFDCTENLWKTLTAIICRNPRLQQMQENAAYHRKHIRPRDKYPNSPHRDCSREQAEHWGRVRKK
ncbi:uncharacterized protein LOC125032435 [Penaeus chinensis]|uniref:uncharacterized protein LOC125032435 n=1 Tax=Penaeus chinensis TaxID=139456 RepID=UPI001FB849C3|nr:uncharacterized protein LOC125032435 [Penaeus chinensis]